MTSPKILEILRQSSRSGVNPAGENYRYLTLEDTVSLAGRLGLTRRELEIAALEAGIVPDRYQRNLGTIGIAGQIKLLRAHAVSYTHLLLPSCGIRMHHPRNALPIYRSWPL